MNKIKKITKALVGIGTMALILIMPLVVNAATSSMGGQVSNTTTTTKTGFEGAVLVIKNAINVVLPIIISLGVLYFVWGVFQYVRTDDSSKQAEARSYIIWSIIFITVMVSVWGLVNIITTTFNLDSKTVPPPPPIPEYSS